MAINYKFSTKWQGKLREDTIISPRLKNENFVSSIFLNWSNAKLCHHMPVASLIFENVDITTCIKLSLDIIIVALNEYNTKL